jgi:Transposase DDE domain
LPRNVSRSEPDKVGAMQLHCFRPGDTVVFDRGYYSEEILSILTKKKINFIFRMQRGPGLVTKLINSKSNDLLIEQRINKNEYVNVRMIKYTCNEIDKEHRNVIKKKYKKAKKKDLERNPHKQLQNKYYLATSDMTSSVKDFMNFYHERWDIETPGRKRPARLKRTGKAGRFYVKYVLTEDNTKNYKLNEKINTHTCINLVVTKLIKILFLKFNKINQKYWAMKMNNILKIITKTKVVVEKGRYFERVRKKPVSKWRVSGTTSGRPKVEKEKKLINVEQETNNNKIKMNNTKRIKNKKKLINVEHDTNNNKIKINNTKRIKNKKQKCNKQKKSRLAANKSLKCISIHS